MTRGGRDQQFWNIRVMRLLWMSPNAAFEVEATRRAAAKIVVRARKYHFRAVQDCFETMILLHVLIDCCCIEAKL